MLNKKFILLAAFITALSFSSIALAGGSGEPKKVTFKVRVENIADKAGIVAQDGSRYPFALSPGFYTLTDSRKNELFTVGKRASRELESQAEDGNPEGFYKRFLTRLGSVYLGVFNKPVGSDMAAPIFSGGAFEFTFVAAKGQKLTLTTMYGQSNDLFYAPETPIDLFDAKGKPISGDITSKFQLWDAGTEVNEAPGLGPNQAPRQKGPNTGVDENGVVRVVKDGFTYPETQSVLRVTVTVE